MVGVAKRLLCQSLEKSKEIYKEYFFESCSNEDKSSDLSNATFNFDIHTIDINSWYGNNSDNNDWQRNWSIISKFYIEEYLSSKRANKDEDILE